MNKERNCCIAFQGWNNLEKIGTGKLNRGGKRRRGRSRKEEKEKQIIKDKILGEE